MEKAKGGSRSWLTSTEDVCKYVGDHLDLDFVKIWDFFLKCPNNLESKDTLENYVLFIFNHSLATMWETVAFDGFHWSPCRHVATEGQSIQADLPQVTSSLVTTVNSSMTPSVIDEFEVLQMMVFQTKCLCCRRRCQVCHMFVVAYS